MEGGAAPRQFEVDGGPVLRGEVAGEGEELPIVLCHGLTATRHSVVHGSRRLQRAGHRLITYDARGHGESDPAATEGGYGYPALIEDLDRVLTATVGEGPFLLGGHSMGAHTAIGYALHSPGRVAGLIAIGPTYTGPLDAEALAYWDGLAAALRDQGIEGFLAYIDREQGADPVRRDAVLRFTRERMLRHRHLDPIVAALRGIPRSQPFGSLADLADLEVPALVVASGDEADPGHPYETAVAYAEALPRARLVSEAAGQSPLAWQGGRLSREIETFYRELQ